MKIDKDKIIYTNEGNITYEVSSNTKLVVYHYSIDSSSNIKIYLNGDNSEVEYHYSIINKNNNTYKINIYHLGNNTISNIYNHGVNVFDNKLLFDVNSKVENKYTGCYLNQENQIINLSNGNSIIKPNLLIDNFDVSSTHSAFIGTFSEDIVFYLMSRGIKRNTAIKLLINSLLINGGDTTNAIVKEFLVEVENGTNG